MCFALRGSPPHLSGIRKVGNGASARWVLGTYRWRGQSLSFGLGLDRHPGILAAKLVVVDDATGSGDERKRKKVGFLLLEALPNGNALRGLRVSDAYRGCGYSRQLLAIWVALCLTAGCSPSTRMINKPVVALLLHQLGFSPLPGRGVLVRVTAARRYRDCVVETEGAAAESGAAVGGQLQTAVRVRAEFQPPKDASRLQAAVDNILGEGQLELLVSPEQLRRALLADCVDEERHLR